MKVIYSLLALMIAFILGYVFCVVEGERDLLWSYDPNDRAYKFIPEAPDDWIAEFGTSERTRLLHSISELRVVVAAQGKRILALEDPNTPKPEDRKGN